MAGQYDVFTALTTTLFGKWPLPPGWNIANKNDAILHITTTGGSVGAIAGSWTITGIDIQGSHDHAGVTGQAIGSFRIGDSNAKNKRASLVKHTHSLQVDGLHSHAFADSWRPAYTKLVEGVLA